MRDNLAASIQLQSFGCDPMGMSLHTHSCALKQRLCAGSLSKDRRLEEIQTSARAEEKPQFVRGSSTRQTPAAAEKQTLSCRLWRQLWPVGPRRTRGATVCWHRRCCSGSEGVDSCPGAAGTDDHNVVPKTSEISPLTGLEAPSPKSGGRQWASRGSVLTALGPGPSTAMMAATTKVSGGFESSPNPTPTHLGEHMRQQALAPVQPCLALQAGDRLPRCGCP